MLHEHRQQFGSNNNPKSTALPVLSFRNEQHVMNSTISIASIEHKNDDNSRNIQNAVVKLQQSVSNGFKTCSSVGGAGNPNHFRIMLIRTWVRKIQDVCGVLRGQSCIQHPPESFQNQYGPGFKTQDCPEVLPGNLGSWIPAQIEMIRG